MLECILLANFGLMSCWNPNNFSKTILVSLKGKRKQLNAPVNSAKGDRRKLKSGGIRM